MVNSISLNAYSYGGILSGSSGKLYVPVNPASVIYSQFDHISGVASSIKLSFKPAYFHEKPAKSRIFRQVKFER